MGKLFSYFGAALSEKKSAFAVYRKPGENIVRGIFGYEDAAYTYQSDVDGFVFVPFDEGEKIFIRSDSSTVLAEAFHVGKPGNNGIIEPVPNTYDRVNFEGLVAKSVTAINNGQFEKLVCSRVETVEVENVDVEDAFRKMLNAYPDAFCYCFFSPETGLWMGATPEQLLKVTGSTLHTVALAGTQVYNRNDKVIWPEKEKQEQQFVTDYIVNKLEDFSDDIKVTAPYTYQAGNIIHIRTDIYAEMPLDAKLQDVIDALHPTPAVCGLPENEAKEFLLKNEGYDREYYSGYLGEVTVGETNLFVNLRCMKIEDNIARIFVGCGITKDSDPEKEFSETVNKSLTMRRVL